MDTTILNSGTSIFQSFSNFMDEKENMKKRLKQFIDELILENAKDNGDSFSLFACDLEHHDKRIFLSYIVSPGLFEELTENFYRELEAFKEYEHDMQHFIDQRIDTFYLEYHEDKKNHANDGYEPCLTISLT